MDIHTYTYTGWWLLLAPLKNDGVKVSWDDDIPNWMEKTCSKPPTRKILAVELAMQEWNRLKVGETEDSNWFHPMIKWLFGNIKKPGFHN